MPIMLPDLEENDVFRFGARAQGTHKCGYYQVVSKNSHELVAQGIDGEALGHRLFIGLAGTRGEKARKRMPVIPRDPKGHKRPPAPPKSETEKEFRRLVMKLGGKSRTLCSVEPGRSRVTGGGLGRIFVYPLGSYLGARCYDHLLSWDEGVEQLKEWLGRAHPDKYTAEELALTPRAHERKPVDVGSGPDAGEMPHTRMRTTSHT